MKTSLRKALIAVAVVAVAGITSSLMAQTPPGPPNCGSVASLMKADLYPDAFGAKGDNILSIPSVGPVNADASQGFRRLCDRFGLGAAGDAGATSTLIQFNAQSGSTITYQCSQAVAPTFTAGQAVLIRPTGTGAAAGPPITGNIPGVECSRRYVAYGEGSGATGDNLFPVPLSFISNQALDLCSQLGLAGTAAQVIQFDANLGNIGTQLCNAAVNTVVLKLGGGVLIRPACAAGTACNTASGAAVTIF